MKPGSDKIVARALRALERAEEHVHGGAPDRAAERAYHAIVYAARALLNESGDRTRSHDEVRSRVEALSPPAPDRLLQALARSVAWRESGEPLDPADAERLVALAGPAVRDVRELIEMEE